MPFSALDRASPNPGYLVITMSQLLRRGHLTTGIAAQVLGLSQQHVITLCNQGVIQADRTKHARRITPFEVMRIQAARQQGATAQ